MSQTRIVWLDARADADDKAIGPKAASLVRLSRIGLTVPAGFCIPVEAYREHAETNGIARQVAPASDTLASVPPEERRTILAGIREAIIKAPMTEETRRAVEMHYHRLKAGFVAVRSSATAEDLPGQSFAGQYDTYLGITDIDECLAAVKQCWASLWTERAWDYREQDGFDHRAVGMAVIVQALVPADASGVLFTTDPATGAATGSSSRPASGSGRPSSGAKSRRTDSSYENAISTSSPGPSATRESRACSINMAVFDSNRSRRSGRLSHPSKGVR